jgi:hypothetical protein
MCVGSATTNSAQTPKWGLLAPAMAKLVTFTYIAYHHIAPTPTESIDAMNTMITVLHAFLIADGIKKD